MAKTTPKAFLTVLLLFSIQFAALPQFGYSQATSQASAVDYSKQLQTIEEKVEARRKELGIPGMSLAIVKDGQVIFMKGFGYKDFENKLAATPDTQFAIGSTTKAMTALTVLMSQDEGKLSLDDSPKKHLSYFKINDSEIDKNITVRDLLNHGSGLGRTDLVWLPAKLTREEVIRAVGEAKPTAKLREKFQYQNVMFAAAGEVVAKVHKKTWEQVIAERIFAPLAMTNSNFSVDKMQKTKDFSFGYSYDRDKKETNLLPYRNIDEIGPAGSINSSARDMAQWVKFVLNGGMVNGKRLVSETGYAEWLNPRMKISAKTGYALGWGVGEWNGKRLVNHSGGIDGFNSLVAMLPDQKLGFVMLTNVSSSSLGGDIMPIIWENILGKPDATKTDVATVAPEEEVGKYRFEAAGFDVDVQWKDSTLIAIVPGQPTYTLEKVSGRRYKLNGAPDGFFVTFKDKELYLEQPQGNYTLPRVETNGATDARNADAAKELIGKYSMPDSSGTIEIKEADGKVTFNIGSQPPYALVEKSKDLYRMSPLPDAYSLKAKRDAAGKLVSVMVTQPEGEFEFKRLDEKSEDKPTITADELMQKAIDAAGGDTAWRKLTSRTTTFTVDLENQGVQGYGRVYSKAPNMSATETTMTALGKKIATGWEYFDGQTGAEAYTFMPAAEKYTGARLDDVKTANDFYGILNWKSLFKTVAIKRKGKVGDDECWIVEFTPNKGTTFAEYYSTKTFLLRKREGVITSSTNDSKIPYSIVFDDYRDVDGVKVAFKTTANNIGNGNIVTTFREVKHNVELDDKMFAPRKP